MQRVINDRDEAVGLVMDLAGEACSERQAAAVVALLRDRGLAYGDDWGSYLQGMPEKQWLAILDEGCKIADEAS